jgi:hypothetical protein
MKRYSPEEAVSKRLSKKDDNFIFENRNIFTNDQDRTFSFLVSVNEEKCHCILDVCNNILRDDWVDRTKETIKLEMNTSERNSSQIQKGNPFDIFIDST